MHTRQAVSLNSFSAITYKGKFGYRMASYKGSRTLVTGRGLAAFKTLIDNDGYNRHTMKKHGGRKAK